ncbi:response regulator transcription factor [Butyrivibrio sp. VCD2006]|uniref:response regulator transcription factor n=1 Tax=Butyrivibrio sp. VCD2006 TaxID=1280664 RepID=UPI0003FD9D02|nr:response regulator [Butyrivibrio sp. VCD2006]
MYRVMIIDDEESARKLMRAAIDYKSLDMEVVGEAASGIEAINIIDDLKPDIAFVDISMPFMNGIEFTETATERYPNLIIIIMTALDQFEYARKCVSLPVFDYMLKPMVRAEVTKVLERAKEKLDNMLPSASDFDEEFSGDDADFAVGEADSTELIKKYVHDNITDPKLNLAFVAQNFGFSASYLSRKFKQDTGKNFAKYLTDLRMKKAIKYAGLGYKMYQTAAEVGIPDPNYFGRCFKKYVGMSYSDYVLEKCQKSS